MAFNENSRVKIPALLHLVRLEYNYLPLSDVYNGDDGPVKTADTGPGISGVIGPLSICNNKVLVNQFNCFFFLKDSPSSSIL
ncbi:hypothetical protein SAMN05518672_10928 [Chitinophaga sp. CF118]|nr:hypothetical protein SAMN05518672_10928 [Chitinophaga sp. CF118]